MPDAVVQSDWAGEVFLGVHWLLQQATFFHDGQVVTNVVIEFVASAHSFVALLGSICITLGMSHTLVGLDCPVSGFFRLNFEFCWAKFCPCWSQLCSSKSAITFDVPVLWRWS